jgi:sphingosine kinase
MEPNPFDDPTGSDQAAAHLHSVLTVDRNATLTLGTDALIVLDDCLSYRREPRNCCGLLPRSTKTTRAIPFYNVLWATLDDFEITVQYAQPAGKKSCTVGHVHYTLTDKSMHAHANAWVEALLDRSYPGGVKRRKRPCAKALDARSGAHFRGGKMRRGRREDCIPWACDRDRGED